MHKKGKLLCCVIIFILYFDDSFDIPVWFPEGLWHGGILPVLPATNKQVVIGLSAHRHVRVIFDLKKNLFEATKPEMKKNNRLHYVQNIFMCTAIFQVQSVIIEAISKGSSTVITGIYTDRQSGLSLITVHDQEWRWTGLLCGILCKLCNNFWDISLHHFCMRCTLHYCAISYHLLVVFFSVFRVSYCD